MSNKIGNHQMLWVDPIKTFKFSKIDPDCDTCPIISKHI